MLKNKTLLTCFSFRFQNISGPNEIFNISRQQICEQEISQISIGSIFNFKENKEGSISSQTLKREKERKKEICKHATPNP